MQKTAEVKPSMTSSLQIDFSDECKDFLSFLDNIEIVIENKVQSNYNRNIQLNL